MAFQVCSNISHLDSMDRPMWLGVRSRSPTKPSQLEILQTGLYFFAVPLPRACASNSGLQIDAPSYSEFTCLSHYGPWWAPAPRQSCLRCFLLPSVPFTLSPAAAQRWELRALTWKRESPFPSLSLVWQVFKSMLSVCEMLEASASSRSFPEGRWLWICPRCVCFSSRVSLQAAGTMFPNLSRASSG